MRRIFLFASSIVLLFVSCSKDNDKPEDDPLSFYVHGAGIQMLQDETRAMYMKNKQIVQLPSISGESAIASDIYVSGKDVYIIGATVEVEDYSYTPVKAVLWKNGQLHELHTPASKSAVAQSVFVSGNDVYVAGHYVPSAENAKRQAVIWKNGVITQIGNSNINTRLEDIFVSGSDVYVVGYENQQGGIVSKYWKNGVEKVLSKAGITTYAKSIWVDNPDVYVVGYADATGDRSMKLWKNGVPTNLISGKSVIRGLGVTVENGDVYATGYEQVGSNYVPRVFKNNELLPIKHSNNGHTYAFSTQVVEGNVYVSGQQDESGALKQQIWENGQEIELLTPTATQIGLQSVFIVKKDLKP
ncbi:hypothetical protein ACR79M_04365 [Sphingobacterium spiritivorum]|uniref:hypothetical protein n=1 Tax=Sphingobacterium spiritivorum TaxID=258 RepID=UPI003DA49ADF